MEIFPKKKRKKVSSGDWKVIGLGVRWEYPWEIWLSRSNLINMEISVINIKRFSMKFLLTKNLILVGASF